MVLEQLYSANWIEKKARYAFLMGLTYSIIGIASAILLFKDSPGLAAISFTSLLILPSLNKLLAIEENQIIREKKFNIFLLFRDHWDIIKVYLFLFLGIMTAFSFFSLVWPQIITSQVFSQQAGLLGKATGNAVVQGGFILNLLKNNLMVLIFCLVASLVYGAGSIFIITWNASVWGTIFALIAKESAAVTGQNPFVYFILTILAVSTHMILEASSYFLGAISGGIISKAVVKEKPFSKNFNVILEDGLIMFIIAVVVLIIAVLAEAYLAGSLIGWFGL